MVEIIYKNEKLKKGLITISQQYKKISFRINLRLFLKMLPVKILYRRW